MLHESSVRASGRRRWWKSGRRLLSACLALGLSGCASCRTPPPPALCIQLESTERAGWYNNEPHAVVLYFFPLENATAFEQTDAADLLRGDGAVAGASGPRTEFQILPKEKRELRDRVEPRTRFVGVIADFYGGAQKALLPIGCDGKKLRPLVLFADSIQTDLDEESR